MDSILISEPIRSLDGVVPVLISIRNPDRARGNSHVPSPIVLGHVSERSVDSSLSSDRMTSRGEQLGDTSSLESCLGCTASVVYVQAGTERWQHTKAESGS